MARVGGQNLSGGSPRAVSQQWRTVLTRAVCTFFLFKVLSRSGGYTVLHRTLLVSRVLRFKGQGVLAKKGLPAPQLQVYLKCISRPLAKETECYVSSQQGVAQSKSVMRSGVSLFLRVYTYDCSH